MFIEELKAEKQRIERDLAEMEPKRKRLVLITELLRSYGDGAVQVDLPITHGETAELSRLGPTDATMAVLKNHPHEFLTPREIRDEMRVRGFKSNSNNLTTIITTVCMRKSGDGGDLEAGEKGGVKAYRFKP